MDGDKIINATDWKAKSEDVIKKLDEELFEGISSEDLFDFRYNKDGDIIGKTRRRLKKGEMKPVISPAQVTAKLNRYLRIYRPMTKDEAMTLPDTEYLEAYGYYLDIISHINEYVTFLADKQTFSAFCNINTATYNELMSEQKYAQVFSSIEDGFVQSNFAVAEAGLVDGKTTVAKLQTKDAGHNLIKNPESITFVQNNRVDRVVVNEQLNKFQSMIKQIGNGKK